MTGAILTFLAAGTAIVVAGSVLTRCGDAIAELTGLGRLLVGAVLVAGATSLPEVLVDINAVAREGLPDLAVGDLLGSSLMNLLILATIDFMVRSPRRMLSRMSAAHALSATMAILLTAMVAAAILVPFKHEILGIGTGVWAIGIVYFLGLRMTYFDQRFAADVAGEKAPAPEVGGRKLSLKAATTGFVAAGAVIFLAAPYLAHAAGRIAELTGAGSTFIGSTLVALSTSLPELVATIAAVRMGASDLAVGNIFGSNAFNMVILLPVDLAHPGAVLADVSPAHAITALAVIIVTAVAVLGILYRAEKRIWLIEPDAALVVLLVLGALGLLYALRPAN
ncbi:MAG TPA: sodium:calcium antiporter [Planctomycetota bacterium]|nr:sodium:calcium antiporter [Planctomycetota bacterium]